MTTKFQIGWYTVPEDAEMTDRGFACAAWSRTIAIKAGKYPVMSSGYYYHERDRRYTSQLDNLSISITLPGEIVADDFQSHFCGNPFGTYDTKQNAGNPGLELREEFDRPLTSGNPPRHGMGVEPVSYTHLRRRRCQ